MLKQMVDELKGIGCPLEFSDQNKWLSFLKSGDYCYTANENLETILKIRTEND